MSGSPADERTSRPGPGPGLVGAAIATILLASACQPAQTEHGLSFVTTARQLGPVAYRDPLGVPSPDGRWLATHVGLHLRILPLPDGPPRELAGGQRRRLHLAWRPDSRHLAAREADRDRSWFDWFEYDTGGAVREHLWGRKPAWVSPDGTRVERGDLLELAFARDGGIAGLVALPDARQVWMFDDDGNVLEAIGSPGRFSNIAWTPDGTVACVDASSGSHQLSLECGVGEARADLGEVRGPIAFSGSHVYAGRPANDGFLDLWRLDPSTGETEQLSHFSRDTYAPYALEDGRVLFKLQEYAVTIARVDADGGYPVPVTTFQSETPSWDWAGERIAFTFGSWRRVIDDAGYPDIAQHVGHVRVADGIADEPLEVVRRSYSEDQGMHWSPDGRWIVLHSHADGTDDIWLQPADGSAEAWPISSGGHETGWPRFSPDGSWIVYPTDYRAPDDDPDGEDRLGLLQLVGFDQESGGVTVPQHEIELAGFEGRAIFAEFGPDSRTIYFEAIHDIGERAIWKVDREGGEPELIHRYFSEQWFTGITVSPDGQWVVYVAPAQDGRMQLHRVRADPPPRRADGRPGRWEGFPITYDDSDKTHPSWSPRGDQIAFTVFEYLAHFWLLEPPS